MRVAVIGLGAIGVSMVRNLQRIGIEPIGFSDHPHDRFEVRTGKRVERIEVEAHTEVSAAHPGTFDALILCLKNHVLVHAFDRYRSLLKPEGVVVCAQNGIMEYFLAERFGTDGLLGAIVVGNAMHTGPGCIEIALPVTLVVGPLHRGPSDRLRPVLSVFEKAHFSRTAPEILPFKWTKLCFSSVANPLSAITGLRADALLRKRAVRRIGLRIINEVLPLAQAEDITLVKEGPVSPTWFRDGNRVPAPVKHAILLAFSLALEGIKVSMLQDIEAGRPTEVEYLNGFIVDRAARHGIPAPYNELTVRLVKELESGATRPDVANLSRYDVLV